MNEATVSLAVPTEIHTTRDYDAPPARVWAAFTDPAHTAHWWGPDGFGTRTLSHDLRVGGHWQHTMTGPDGTVWPNFMRYTAVEPGVRLAWDHGTAEGEPPLFRCEVRFEPLPGGRTRLVLKHVFASAEARDATIARANALEGAKQTTARLAAYLAR